MDDELTIASGDTAQPAPETGDTGQPAPGTTPEGSTGETDGQPAPAPQEPEKGPVPYERFDEVNAQKNALQDQVQQLTQYITAQRQQGQKQGQPQQPQPQDMLSQLGLTADDMLTDQGLQRYTNSVVGLMQQQIQGLRQEIAAMMNQSQTPDLAVVVGTQNPTTGQFQYGQALQTYMNAHPAQAQALAYMAQLPQTQTIVYDLITRDPSYAQQQQRAQQQQQQNVVRQVQQMNQRTPNAAELAQSGGIDQLEIRSNWTPEQTAAHVEQMKQRAG